MVGYSGHSKSNNAVSAESGGRYPLSTAVTIFSKENKVSRALAKAWILHQGTSEWHHTSSHYNITPYYNTAICDDEEFADFVKKWTPTLKQPAPLIQTGRLEYKEWGGSRSYPTCTIHHYEGEYSRVGDYFKFDGKRKKYTNCKEVI